MLVGRKMNARILDLCSGSGCIGCALAHELPAARVVMVDISDAALAVSKENLRRNRQNRTICLKADALEKPPMSIGTFDIIVSNPPYVASMDILTLDSSVRDYEPLGALVRPRADGKALLDLKGVNARRLAQLGIPAEQIAVSDACTMCRPDVFWSHRATDGRRGVQAAVITL